MRRLTCNFLCERSCSSNQRSLNLITRIIVSSTHKTANQILVVEVLAGTGMVDTECRSADGVKSIHQAQQRTTDGGTPPTWSCVSNSSRTGVHFSSRNLKKMQVAEIPLVGMYPITAPLGEGCWIFQGNTYCIDERDRATSGHQCVSQVDFPVFTTT